MTCRCQRDARPPSLLPLRPARHRPKRLAKNAADRSHQAGSTLAKPMELHGVDIEPWSQRFWPHLANPRILWHAQPHQVLALYSCITKCHDVLFLFFFVREGEASSGVRAGMGSGLIATRHTGSEPEVVFQVLAETNLSAHGYLFNHEHPSRPALRSLDRCEGWTEILDFAHGQQ